VTGAPQDQLELLKDAIRRTNCELDAASDANCRPALFVASAGNRRTDNDAHDHYPSNFTDLKNVIAVAATNQGDELWIEPCAIAPCKAGSNWGATTVHIAAPGADILSTFLRDQEEGATYTDGTSMAAPHVAGCAALLQAKRLATSSSSLLPKDLKEILMSAGDQPLDGRGNKLLDGKIMDARRLNCASAMAR